MADPDNIPANPKKSSTLRINLKCPAERALLEKYYSERRVLDTSVPKEVVNAFKLKEEKQLIRNKKQNDRYKNIVENEPDKLVKIREQSRVNKQTYREREKQKRLAEDDDSSVCESTVSSKLFPSGTESSNSVCGDSVCSQPRTLNRKADEGVKARKPRERVAVVHSDRDDDFSDDTVVEEPAPPQPKSRPKPNFYFGGGMRF